MVKCSTFLFWSAVSGAQAGRTGCNDITCKGASEYVLPLDHPLTAKKNNAVAEQVHLIGGSPGKAGVVWTGPLLADPGSQGVEYCEQDGDAQTCAEATEKFVVAEGPSVYDAMDGVYREDYDGELCPDYHEGEHCFYTSPPHYYALLDGLSLQAQTYLYRIRGETAWRSFRSAPAVGQPISFGVIADLGHYNDSVATMDAAAYQMQNGLIDTMLFGGDLAYANGVGVRWDAYGRLQERLFSKVLTAHVGGNHEIEKGMENWVHYTNRYPSMHLKKDSRSPSDLFYSFEAGLAHVVMLCSYCPTEPGSAQYDWLTYDLAQVDHSVTPWIVGVWHSPWYTSCSKHTMHETGDMRSHLEDMLHEAGMDIVFAGHNHAYERTNPIYKNVTDSCGGAIYITVGDGGGASPDDKDQNGAPPDENNGFSKPWVTAENPKPPLYGQPEWSQVRAFEWGFGRFTIRNATHAEWDWYNSYDSEHAIKDHVSLVHKSECRGKLVV